MRPLRSAALVALAGVSCTLVLGGCKDDKGTSSSTTSTTTAPAGTSTTASGSSGTTAVTALTGASLTPVSTPVAGRALLVAVRTSTNPGFDRIVFEFEGGEAPGYAVQYGQRPVQEDGSGNPVTVRGDAVLEMRMEHASGADLSGGTFRQTYTGPKQLAVNGPAIVDVARAGDFEGVLRWVAGTTGKLPFKVQALTNPTRIVVDVAHPGTTG